MSLKKLFTYGLMGLGAAAYIYDQNFRTKQTRYYVESPIFLETLNGYTIVQISDLHYPKQRVSLDDVITTIDKIRPNLIVLTGDNIAKSAEDFDEKEWYSFGVALTHMAPTYAVSGENELVNPIARQAEQQFIQAGVVYLNDQAVTLTYREQEITLMGLMEKPGRRFLKGDVLRYISLTSAQIQQPKILLAHHPEAFLRYHEDIQKSPDLVLAGHAHGGEIRIPGIGGIKARNQGYLPQCTEGIFHIPGNPNKKMVVSKGIGQGEFPVRINNKPEVVSLELMGNEAHNVAQKLSQIEQTLLTEDMTDAVPLTTSEMQLSKNKEIIEMEPK